MDDEEHMDLDNSLDPAQPYAPIAVAGEPQQEAQSSPDVLEMKEMIDVASADAPSMPAEFALATSLLPPPRSPGPLCFACRQPAPPVLLSCCACSNRFHHTAQCMGSGNETQCGECVAAWEGTQLSQPELVVPSAAIARLTTAPTTAGRSSAGRSAAAASSHSEDDEDRPLLAARPARTIREALRLSQQPQKEILDLTED
jgi:hypothetical protein